MLAENMSETPAKRAPLTSFHGWVKADSSAEFPAEAGRYHLYVSLACPFASRANFMVSYKGLEGAISTSVVHYLRGEKGWEFAPGNYRTDADTVNGKQYLREIYEMCAPEYTGRITVPVLFDKKTERIVNNESSEILRMLSTEFDEFCATDAQRAINLYPEGVRDAVDEWNALISETVNSGVYNCGFAKTQEEYDKPVAELFDALDRLEEQLSKHRYVVGAVMTEADVRLFMSLVRFDMVYAGLFKCNKRRIVDYPNLMAHTREMYQLQGVEPTVDRFHIEHHYQRVFTQINPFGIVAIGPQPLDFTAPHGRDNM